MLTNVHLKNLALIQEADINYDAGLNIMTGETGSGKSIIISSINIALGEKANKGIIRTGCTQGSVELTFISDKSDVHNLIRSYGIEDESNTITITRKLTLDGSSAKINGESSSLANVKQLTSLLIDIHGQHDHQSLLDPDNHISILDSFGGKDLANVKSAFKLSYNNFKATRKLAQNYNLDESALEREVSLLKYQIKEIDEAELTTGEDDKLEAEYKQLSQWEKSSDNINNALAVLSDESSGAESKIYKALLEISAVIASGSADGDLTAYKNTLTDLDSVCKDLIHDISKYAQNHRFDAERFAKVRNRLDQINLLKSKYGNTVADILEFRESIAAKLADYASYSKTRENLKTKLSELKVQLNKDAVSLSEQRKSAAARLMPMITSNLEELNFLTVNFVIDIKKAEKINENGFDKVEFLISTNPGESPKPLAKIASGGELSRIMLAIKSSIAENDNIPSLIFDEIDTGISGRTAQAVAQKLNILSKSHQIICITHLPQIAAMADTHFSIHKEIEGESTISGIVKLNDDEITYELAKLIGGAQITETTLESAHELKLQADKYKTDNK